MLFNIILRFLTNDDPVKAEDCEALLRRAEDGEEEVFLPELVIADIVWTLEKDYRVERSRIREMMSRILALSSLRCKSKSTVVTAFKFFVEKNIEWTDAFVAAQMISSSQPEIYSYNSDFDRIEGITREVPLQH